MKAIWNGKVIVESDDTVIVEGNHYFPVESFKKEFTAPSKHTSGCPWKGTANYFNLVVDGKVNENAVWYYTAPKSAASQILNRVAFWKDVEVL